jgi:hypothetical protein
MLNSGSPPYAAVLTAKADARFVLTRTRFTPGRFITVDGSSRVLMPTFDGRLLYLSSWSIAADVGLPSSPYRTAVSPSVLTGYSEAGEISLFVRCSGVIYIGTGGVLRPVAASAASGFSVADLDTSACGTVKRAGVAQLERVLLQAAGQSKVYLAENGRLRHVTDPSVLRSLGGGVTTPILTASPNSIDRLPKGEPKTTSMVAGEFVQNSSTGRVVLAVGETRSFYLPSWAVARELGLRAQVAQTLPAAQFTGLTEAGTLSQFVMCGGRTYFAAQGQLREVTSEVAKGSAVSDVGASVCAQLRISSAPALSQLFLQGVGSSPVYIVEGGALRHVTSLALLTQLGGGVMPEILGVSQAALDRLPKGQPKT